MYLVVPLHLRRQMQVVESGLGKGFQHVHLAGLGAVELDIRVVLKGGDVQLFTPPHIGPHLHRHIRLPGPELGVPHGPSGQTHPCALVHHVPLLVHHVGAGGDIDLHGVPVFPGDDVVEGVDALEDGDFIRTQLEGVGLDGGAHLPGKLELGDEDFLTLVQHIEVPVEQVHIQAEGGFIVDLALPVPGAGLRVYGLEVVVQGDGVGVDAHFLQLCLDLLGRGGFPAARRA